LPIEFNLAVIKAPRLGRNTTVFDRVFRGSELTGANNGGTFLGAFDLNALNAMPGSGRHLIYLNTEFQLSGKTAMNANALGIDFKQVHSISL
jgi:hypothetical protein